MDNNNAISVKVDPFNQCCLRRIYCSQYVTNLQDGEDGVVGEGAWTHTVAAAPSQRGIILLGNKLLGADFYRQPCFSLKVAHSDDMLGMLMQ